MWLAVVPLLVIGVFLFITWDTLSPVKFIKQHREARERRRREWEEMCKDDGEEEDEYDLN